MTSRIIVNNIQSDTGVSTITFGSPILAPTFIGNVNATSGVTTFTTVNIGTGTSISSPTSNTLTFGVNNVERIRVNTTGVGVGTNIISRPFEVWAGTAGTSFSVDTAGRVQMPFQPAFDTIGSGTLAFSGSQTNVKITLASALANVSGSYSTANSRFIAPVSGTYLFYLSTATTTATSSGPALLFFKNGSQLKEIAINYSNVFYTQFGGSIIVSAVANDFFEVYISNFNNTSFTIDLSRTSFGGHLVG